MPKWAGPYWTDARVTLEIFELGSERPYPIVLDRPFGLVGRIAFADIRFEDRGVSLRHAYLHADARGLFVVDLATRTGIRFGDVDAPYGWLRPGDSIEVAGRVIRVESFEVGGHFATPPPCNVNLLGDAGNAGLVGVTIEPVGQRGPSWALGSELAFVGRGDGCAIRLNQASVSRTHCALLRTSQNAFVVDLPGRPTLVNGQPPRGATALMDGDVLTFGQVRFVVRLSPAYNPPAAAGEIQADMTTHGLELARFTAGSPAQYLAALPAANGQPFPIELVPPESRDAVLGWMLGTLHAGQSEILRRQDELQLAIGVILKQLQSDTTARLDAQNNRLDTLADQLQRLASQSQAQPPNPFHPAPYPYPALPDPSRPAPNVPPAPEIDPARSLATAAWLLNRIDKVGTDNKLSFRSILTRLGGRKPDDAISENPTKDTEILPEGESNQPIDFQGD